MTYLYQRLTGKGTDMEEFGK